MTDDHREGRLALYFSQRSEIKSRTESEVSSFSATSAVFSSSALKTLLSFNAAAVLGYPIFLSQLKPSLTDPAVYATLETSFWFFFFALAAALMSAYITYLSYAILARNAYHERNIELVKIIEIARSTLQVDDEANNEHVEKAKAADKSNRRWITITMWACSILGFASFFLMTFAIYNAAELFQTLAVANSASSP